VAPRVNPQTWMIPKKSGLSVSVQHPFSRGDRPSTHAIV
jgi:hypothetical protein